MRAEQVFEVVSDILSDFEEFDVVGRVERLNSALESLVASSTEENQIRVSELKAELLDALKSSRFNRYPISLQQTLDEMRVKQFLGNAAARRVERAFTGNQITPAGTLKKMRVVETAISNLRERASEFTESAEYFEISSDNLELGEYEFAVSIPRAAVDNELNDFGKELVKLDKLFGVFSEIAIGSRPDFKIRAISSSELTVFLESAPGLAVLLAAAFERVAKIYERVLNIIKIHRDLKNQNLPDTVLDPLKAHIEETVRNEIEAAAKELEANISKKIDDGRRRELQNELRSALKGIAARLDRGYIFDVRGGGPAEPEEGEDNPTPPDPKELERLRAIEEARQSLRHFKPQDGPILGLPEPKHSEDDEK